MRADANINPFFRCGECPACVAWQTVGPAAPAATGERRGRYKAQFGSGFSIFLFREIAQAANHVGWKRGVNFIPGLRKLSHFKLDCLYSLLCQCQALLQVLQLLTLELILIITVL